MKEEERCIPSDYIHIVSEKLATTKSKGNEIKQMIFSNHGAHNENACYCQVEVKVGGGSGKQDS